MKRAWIDTPNNDASDEKLRRVKRQAKDSQRSPLTRSQQMTLNATKLPGFDGKQLKTDKLTYFAITHLVVFSSKKLLASVGAGVDLRDIILLDADSKELDKYYQLFLESHRGKKYSVDEFLLKLCKFIRKQLAPSKTSKALTGDYAKVVSTTGKTVGLIPLESFIASNVRSCCVYALFCAYLLNRLVKDKILPAGSVHLNRDHAVGVKLEGKHAWVIYKLESGAIYLLDCTKFAPKHVVEFLSNLDYVKDNYGEEAFLEMVRRYTDLSEVSSPELSGESTLPLSEENTLPLSYSSE